MTLLALDLLAEARRHGVQLISSPAGTLKARARTPPPADLLVKLRAHREELLAALTAAEDADYEERVGIGTHDAGVPREWAEGFARLDGTRPPRDVPAYRWRLFIDDCGRFLDGGWAIRAAALGWSPLALFGCDLVRPFSRIDQAGLLWLLTGRRLVVLTADTAIIEARTGGRLTYRRRQIEPGSAVLAWELVA